MISPTAKANLILQVAASNSGNWSETNFPYLSKGEQGMHLRDAEQAFAIIEPMIRDDALEEAAKWHDEQAEKYLKLAANAGEDFRDYGMSTLHRDSAADIRAMKGNGDG